MIDGALSDKPAQTHEVVVMVQREVAETLPQRVIVEMFLGFWIRTMLCIMDQE